MMQNKAARVETFSLTPGCVATTTLAAALLNAFFLGESDALIGILDSELDHACQKLDHFAKRIICDDLSALREFYQGGPVRNAALRARHELSDPLIAQDEIDDLNTLAVCK
jgi:hypothetical protein